MKLKIITIGAPQLAFARDGFEEYVKRLSRFHQIDVVHVKDQKGAEEKMTALLRGFVVALDEGGKMFSSQELGQFLEKKSVEGIGEMTFLIGGPDGHSEVLRSRADLVWSHGPGTLPHDIAMLITAEALYRASTINAGHPYHRN